MSREEKLYVVQTRCRAIQQYTVYAHSATEAERKVSALDVDMDTGVFEVVWSGKPKAEQQD